VGGLNAVEPTRARVEAHKGLVKKLASEIRRRYRLTVELDELEAAGLEGLVQADRAFDAARGVAFATFAYYRVQGAILDDCRRLGLLRRQYRSRAQFELAAGEVLARAAETTPAAPGPGSASWLAATFDGLAVAFSLSEQAQEPVEASPGPEAEVTQHQLLGRLEQALAVLTPEERRVVDLYYFQDRRMADIASDLGMSTAWVSRVHTRALKRLKTPLLGLREGA
jgi:RNA polymerase sigma factor for flagellar operon FliA